MKGKGMIDLQNFIVVGISHETLSLVEREKIMKTRPKNIIEKLFKEKKINGYINLSTCLRMEFYIELNSESKIDEIEEPFIIKELNLKRGEEAIRYLFEVSCGFYSVIKGEDQILAQIKHSYNLSLEENYSTKMLNIIFNKTIELAKKFRTESLIAHNALSIEAISLNYIKSMYKDLSDKEIFILGAGDLSQSILGLLVKEKLEHIYITNRTYKKIEDIKKKFNTLNLVEFKDKYSSLTKTDIIISATSAAHIVVDYDKFVNLMDTNRNYIFLDLAVPRDVDERLADLDNVKIYNLDDIWKIYHKNFSNRDKLLKDYYYLIDEQIQKIIKTFSYYKKVV